MYRGGSPCQALSVEGDKEGPRSSDRKVHREGKMRLCKEVRMATGKLPGGATG